MSAWVRMGARVEALVRRSGGTVAEEAAAAQLAATHGLWWARDAVHYALVDGRVFRTYADGADTLTIPDDVEVRP